jgi:hypothetical protein
MAFQPLIHRLVLFLVVFIVSACNQANAFTIPQKYTKCYQLSRGNNGVKRMSASSDQEEEGRKMPKLVVFDLDNTLWTPELYQLRKLQRMNADPVAGEDIQIDCICIHFF